MKLTVVFLSIFVVAACYQTRKIRALQKSHEKTPIEKWEAKFIRKATQFDQTSSLVALLGKIALEHLAGCTTVILYDTFTEISSDLLLEKLFRSFPIPYVHGQITDKYSIKDPKLLEAKKSCVNYVLFLKDVMRCKSVIGPQTSSKVVLVARSSQWRVYEFLANEESQDILNLIVIAMSEKIVSSQIELPYILYTHKLYIDALGSSIHQVITSWKNRTLTRPHVALFPAKVDTGFAGHRFIISLAHQPPFVIKRGKDKNEDIQWDGIEIRLVNVLAKMYNFTTDFREPKDYDKYGASESVTNMVKFNKANLGIGGLYITNERIKSVDTSYSHTQDCASFVTLTSTALPRYRAIMGPFHWSVWLTLTAVYMFAILPLAFSDKHSLRHLVETPQEIENMFWYVFGTFTNAFTFLGKNSWSKTNKFATRLLIGFYWMFTIIITACYTGSIIAFVTLPIFPETIDNVNQLLHGHFQLGTLDKGGWQYWFLNSTDPGTAKLIKNVDLVPDVQSGLKNITKAFFWPYAFLGSKAQLDYILRTNFTVMSKRSSMHLSSECFVPFGVSLIYNQNTLYGKIIDMGILRAVQSGLLLKFKNEIEFMVMRSATGRLLSANAIVASVKTLSVEDRALTLDDTQGMFLLLAIGFVLGGASLLSEWLGGCLHLCKKVRAKSGRSLHSNYRSHDNPTPREKIDSLQYNSLMSNDNENRIEEESEVEVMQEVHNCLVHNENGNDINAEIDKLFNFEELFGEESGKVAPEMEEIVVEGSARSND